MAEGTEQLFTAEVPCIESTTRIQNTVDGVLWCFPDDLSPLEDSQVQNVYDGESASPVISIIVEPLHTEQLHGRAR